MHRRVFLVRHGETEQNRQHQLQGRSETALNATGRQQACLAAQALRQASIEQIWSSPQLRARQTAETIATSLNLDIREEPRLQERSFGVLEGRPYSELVELERSSGQSPWQLDINGAESLPQLLHRCEQLAEHIRQSQFSNLLLVGHAGTFRALLGALMELDVEQWFALPQGNACINSLLLDEQGRVVAHQLNDTAHCQ